MSHSVIYQGTSDDRKMVRKYEFWFPGLPAPPPLRGRKGPSKKTKIDYSKYLTKFQVRAPFVMSHAWVCEYARTGCRRFACPRVSRLA